MERKNIVLIVLDSMRKDYADKYIWPVLKKYGFVKYDRAIAPAPWSTPSHVSILTGLYPLHHGTHLSTKVLYEGMVKVRKSLRNIFLPNVLKRRYDYETFLFSANALITPIFGFIFDHFYDTSPLRYTAHIFTQKELECVARNVSQSTKNKLKKLIRILHHCGIKTAMKFLNRRVFLPLSLMISKRWPLDKGVTAMSQLLDNIQFPLNRRSFVLINLMEMHEPYILTVDLDIKKLWSVFYKKSAKYLSTKLEVILEKLIEKLDLQATTFIITSDHGQMLGEHGVFGHTNWLYDELLFVPFYTLNLNCCNNHQTPSSYARQYIPLTSIYYSIVESGDLHRSFALAENFSELKNGTRVFVHRIAVYYKDYKGIFNVDEWKWEEWKTYNNEKEVPEETKREMMRIVLKHLKTAMVKDRVKRLVPKKLKPKKGASS